MTTDPTTDQATTLAAFRALIQGALLTEYRRRIDARIEASPEEHCAALADSVAEALTLRAVVPAPLGRHPRAFLLHPRHGDPLPGVELPGGGVMLFEDWEDGIAVRASSMAYLIAGGYHGARIEWSADALQQPATDARPRCPDCHMPHDLTPGSLPLAVCAVTRERLADAARLHAAGDHHLCCRADCAALPATEEQTR